MFAFFGKWSSRAPRRGKADSDPLADLIRFADQLADSACRASTAPTSLVASDIESAETAAFRILKYLLKERFGEAECRRKLSALPAGAGLSRDLIDWLLQPGQQTFPKSLIDAVSTMVTSAHRLMGEARESLVHDPALTALRVVPAPGESIQDIGRSALRALKGDGPGSLTERSRTLSAAVRNLTLWPADASATFRADLESAVSEVGRLAENVADLRDFYEKARRLEVAASNLQTVSTGLLRSPDPSGELPKQRRNRSVGPALHDFMVDAQAHAALGKFASNVCKYALAVFESLREKWGSALAAGAGLLVPAALLKQSLVSLAMQVDVSWAGSLSKLDPVDGFKLPLIAVACGACLVSVWLSFHSTRRKVLGLIGGEHALRRHAQGRSAGTFILRNAALAGLASVLVYSGAALWIWSDGWTQLIPSAVANETPVAPDATSEPGRPDAEIGFQPVLTFGDVRVLRCARAQCTFGGQTIARGRALSVRNKQTLADTASGALGERDTATVLALSETKPSVELRWSDPVLKHVVDVTGSVSLTGPSSTSTAQLTLAIDDKATNAMGEAMGKALARIRFPATPTRMQIDFPNTFEQKLTELNASLQSESQSLAQLLAISNKSAAATGLLADVVKQQKECEDRRIRRDLGKRIHDGFAGYDCRSP